VLRWLPQRCPAAATAAAPPSTTPKAIATWSSDKNKAIFETLGIYAAEETEACAEVMYENYTTTLAVEAQTLVEEDPLERR